MNLVYLFNMNAFNFDLQLARTPQRQLKAASEQVTPQCQPRVEQTSANDGSTTDRVCVWVIW